MVQVKYPISEDSQSTMRISTMKQLTSEAGQNSSIAIILVRGE